MAARRREVPEDLTTEQKHKLVRWMKRKVKEGTIPKRWCTPQWLRDCVEETLTWHRGHGNPGNWHDWYCCIQNRILKLAKEEREGGGRSRYQQLELPQEPRGSGANLEDPVHISDGLRLVLGGKE